MRWPAWTDKSDHGFRPACGSSPASRLFSLWFFLWLDLLGKYELSQLYAFEGLAPVFLMAAAWLFLGEKVPLRGWIGVSLIAGGLMLVAAA